MNLSICEYNKSYEFNISNITQVLGVNFRSKQFVCDSLIKHFSQYKYQVYDEYMENNIRINGEIPGRREYKIISIKNREELIEQIKMSKNTLIYEYVNNIIETLSCQKQLNIIDEILTKIYMIINEKIEHEIGAICLDYDMQNLLNIVSKSDVLAISGTEIELISNYELFCILFKLVKEINKANLEKIIILLPDIDHLLTSREYEKTMSLLMDYDKMVYVCSFISTNNYLYLSKDIMESVVVLNSTIFQVPCYDVLESFIIDHYPLNCEFTEIEIFNILKKTLNLIGIEDDKISYNELLVKKMINKALCVNDLYDFRMSECELACLNAK